MQTNQTLASPVQNTQWQLAKGQDAAQLRWATISANSEKTLVSDSLCKVLQQCVDNYEILRTGYHLDGQNILWQQISETLTIESQTYDWQSLSPEQSSREKRTVAQQTANIDGTKAQVILSVAQLDHGSWVHLAVPGLNADLFTLKQLMILMLRVGVDGVDAALASLPEEVIQYEELTPWLNDFLLDEELADTRKFWSTVETAQAFSNQFGLARYLGQDEQAHNCINIALGEQLSNISQLAEQLGGSVADVVCASLRQSLNHQAAQFTLVRVLDSRRDEDLEDAIGPLSRALPIIPKTADTLAEAIEAELEAVTEAEDYTECFVRDGKNRHNSYPFVFSHTDGIDSSALAGHIEQSNCFVEAAKIQFTLIEQGAHSHLSVHYNSGFIAPQVIEAFMAQWHDGLIDQLSGDSKGSGIQPLEGAGKPHHDGISHVVDWFEKQGAQSDGQLVDTDGTRVSLHDVNLNANCMAHWLLACDVGKGAQVALCMPRSIAFVTAMLAVAKTGAAYIPVDISLPQARIHTMLEQSGVKLILTNGDSLVEAAQGLDIPQLDLSTTDLSKYDNSSLQVDIHPEDLAYMLYTSGSTGKAKGVGIPHRALTNHMAWMHQAFDYGEKDVFLQRTSVSFDASVWELWSPLLAGATMVIAPAEANYDLNLMQQLIVDNQVSLLQMVPAQLNLLIENKQIADVKSLRYLFCGGESLKSSLANQALAQLCCPVINLYGPSECCIDSVWWRFDPQLQTENVPIGKPIDNVRYLVVRNDGQPASPGEEGELWLGGDCLFTGYQGQPQLTADATGYIDGSSQRYYKTGDYVRVLADGNLYFLERLDNQVKINGFRIELDEIARQTELHGLATQAVCVCDKTTSLLALFVLNGADQIVIKQKLAESLPEYMVPGQVISMTQFPTLSNGKLDIKALTAHARSLNEVAYEAPSTESEKGLAEIWQQALNRESPVGVNSDFFMLGGHSLLAMKVIGIISEQYKVNINLRDLFDYSTVKKLAGRIDALDSGGGDDQIMAMGQQDSDDLNEFEI